MRKLHIKGVVRAANHVRKMLCAPMTPTQRDELRRQIDASVSQIETILARNATDPQHLPAPSRRAYQFLKGIDLDDIELQDAPKNDPGVGRETVWFPGLRAFFDRFLDDVALNIHKGTFKHDASLQVLQMTTDRLNVTMERDHYRPEHLKPESRNLLAWLRVFSREEMLEMYRAAVERAQRTWAKLPFPKHDWHPPFLVQFRPSKHLYRARNVEDGLRVVLESPMVTFDERAFTKIGRQMLGSNAHHEALNEAMMAPAYQELAVELEEAVGVVEHTRGVAHDLLDSFERVNARYFEGSMERPRLKWTRQSTRCVFGHYDFVHDCIWISRTLDRDDVPAYVVDHVMHHELLHKKHGIEWRGKQQHTHTQAFRKEERAFEEYELAAAFLNALSVRA